jgi:ATP-dependent DNA helicase PIF1
MHREMILVCIVRTFQLSISLTTRHHTQLPPIVKQQQEPTIFQDEAQDTRLFCFDSPIWTELGLHTNTIQLSKIQRQEHGSKFEIFLGMVRNGSVPPNILRDFNRKCLKPLPDDGIIPTRIYTHNQDVDSMNESQLARLGGDEVICTAIDEWRERMPIGSSPAVKKNMKASISGELADEVRLKVGAQVMLTRNKDLDNGYQSLVNGSRGVVESFKDDLPIVRFDNGRVEKVAKVEATRYNPDGGIGALVRKQLPLKLAWATTVHKSQGSTLTRAILDISKVSSVILRHFTLCRFQTLILLVTAGL